MIGGPTRARKGLGELRRIKSPQVLRLLLRANAGFHAAAHSITESLFPILGVLRTVMIADVLTGIVTHALTEFIATLIANDIIVLNRSHAARHAAID